MIKKICNDIMKLSSYDLIKKDYSLICFLFFIKDYKLYELKSIEKDLFCKYLYRFYMDNPELRTKHFYKLINNLYKYSPRDLESYCDDILGYIENKSKIIWTDDSKMGLISTLLEPSSKDIVILNQVINLSIKKMMGNTFEYTDKLSRDDFVNYKNSEKLFNRALEKMNYCFICEDNDLNNLTVIRLSDRHIEDINNYLILCKQHAKLYENKELTIKKNGYPYLNRQRLYSHLEIVVLKSIRNYLMDIDDEIKL